MGALLCTSIQNLCNIWLEIFQTLFDSVSQKIDRALNLIWAYSIEKDVMWVKPDWRTDNEAFGSISTRLASIHFQHCAENMATICDDLANETTLEAVKKASNLPAILADRAYHFALLFSGSSISCNCPLWRR